MLSGQAKVSRKFREKQVLVLVLVHGHGRMDAYQADEPPEKAPGESEG